MKLFGWFRKPDLFGAPRSPQWRPVRDAHVEEHPQCFACGAFHDIEVHHIVPFHVDPSLELEPDNLLSLCHNCHFRVGHLGNWRKVNERVTYQCLSERHGRLS